MTSALFKIVVNKQIIYSIIYIYIYTHTHTQDLALNNLQGLKFPITLTQNSSFFFFSFGKCSTESYKKLKNVTV